MTAIQHIPERAPFNYADLIEYREGQITSLALVRSKGVNMTILAFDDEQLLPTHQTPGPPWCRFWTGRRILPWAMKRSTFRRARLS